MLNKLKKSNRKGFTIIEVMIVLAIAGLILLIVFLAVPALQRNSRNTQRKSDINNMLGAISELTANSNGSTVAENCPIPAAAIAPTITPVFVATAGAAAPQAPV